MRRENKNPRLLGGLLTAGYQPGDFTRDLEAVRQAIKSNPNNSIRQIAMICHMGNNAAERYVRMIKDERIA